jgi:hypothetical protein
MVRNISMPLVLALLVWTACLAAGLDLSQRRPLWNDEIFTQMNSIDAVSYRDILLGRFPEGNNSPLYYLLQKSVCDLFQYKFILPWNKEWFLHDDRSQVILRLVSNLCMSSALALMVYFFARFYSWGLGLLALAAALGAPMTWMYWIEARPYALWFFLTTAQSLVFLCLVSGQKESRRGWEWLVLCHLLLSLSAIFGVLQILVVSALLWILKERRWQCYVLLTAVPLALSLISYSTRNVKFALWFREGPWELILQAVPGEYFILLAVSGALMVRSLMTAKGAFPPYWGLAGGTLLAGAVIMGFFKLVAGDGSRGFAISSRYFIFLLPAVILAVTLAAADLWRLFKNDRWMRMNVLLLVGGLLAVRLLETYISILGSGTFMHMIR